MTACQCVPCSAVHHHAIVPRIVFRSARQGDINRFFVHLGNSNRSGLDFQIVQINIPRISCRLEQGQTYDYVFGGVEVRPVLTVQRPFRFIGVRAIVTEDIRPAPAGVQWVVLRQIVSDLRASLIDRRRQPCSARCRTHFNLEKSGNTRCFALRGIDGALILHFRKSNVTNRM
ncbi:MAG: hypothetical protein JW715_05350 [Sedimentisphaerales bacterium]|nr:hypothetical protein [Sedimentisphaerales bacterium]